MEKRKDMKYFKLHSRAEAYNRKKFGNLYNTVKPSIFWPESHYNKTKNYSVFK